eukprot:scaffold207_cov345-Pavlova_lutheri.AAC.18
MLTRVCRTGNPAPTCAQTVPGQDPVSAIPDPSKVPPSTLAPYPPHFPSPKARPPLGTLSLMPVMCSRAMTSKEVAEAPRNIRIMVKWCMAICSVMASGTSVLARSSRKPKPPPVSNAVPRFTMFLFFSPVVSLAKEAAFTRVECTRLVPLRRPVDVPIRA